MMLAYMSTTKRKSYLAFVLLLIISFLSIGSYGIMYLLKFKIKISVQLMMSTLPDSALIEIKKPYTVGAEKEREFIHDGKYYDVAKHKITGDSIQYFCYFDKAETDLAHLSSQWHSIDLAKDKRIQPKHLVKVSDIKYLPNKLNYNSFSNLPHSNFGQVLLPKYQTFIDVLSPPPRWT